MDNISYHQARYRINEGNFDNGIMTNWWKQDIHIGYYYYASLKSWVNFYGKCKSQVIFLEFTLNFIQIVSTF